MVSVKFLIESTFPDRFRVEEKIWFARSYSDNVSHDTIDIWVLSEI